MRISSINVLIASLLLSAGSLFGQVVPAGFYVENAASGAGFNVPVGLAIAEDGRIFVAEKSGVVYIIENGIKLPDPFIDLSAEVLDHWDRGLLGIALDPSFLSNGYVYLMYTVDWDGSGDYQRFDVFGRIVRYTADSINPNTADLSSRQVLLGENYADGIPACYYSHAPGTLRFGTDGTLLASMGDGASFNEVDAGGLYDDCFGAGKFADTEDIGAFRSVYLGSYAGKILRLDPATGEGLTSNPYFTGDPTETESKVWAYGLRNPFRFGVRQDGSTDPADADPGTLYIGDVGWVTWEELNVAKSGGVNFGWPCYEGEGQHNGYQSVTPEHSDCSTVGSVTSPTLYWNHGDVNQSFPPGLGGNSITGGPFYSGHKYPLANRNKVFYADYVRGWLLNAEFDVNNNFIAQSDFGSGMGSIVDLAYDPLSGYLYYVDVWNGNVNRLRHENEDNLAIDCELRLLQSSGSGNFSYMMTFTNQSVSQATTDLWARVTGPAGYDQLVFLLSKSFPGSGSKSKTRNYNISGGVSGQYEMTLFTGVYPDVIACTSTRTYDKTSLTAGLEALPETSFLAANYPNPFNPGTTIQYGLHQSTNVSIRIYNMLGEEVRMLVDQEQEAGYKTVVWDGRDQSGKPVSSGIYIYRLVSRPRSGNMNDGFSQSRKMLLVE